ncbi:IS110 family transposase [Streptomyces sp. 049-1]|uniref:IS110 family transposase n=1 Tax=Streptomyces sp. 049-1 TaxID=2789264 RepID=UPI0039809153
MTQPAPLDQGNPDIVSGVDTHKDVHVAAVVTVAGVFVESRSFPTTAEGYEQLLDWAQTLGHLSQAGVECTGSYGAALSRRRGKSDIVDAEAAARAVISGRATATAKAGDGPVEISGCSRWRRLPRSSPGLRRSTSSRPYSWPPTPSSASLWPA